MSATLAINTSAAPSSGPPSLTIDPFSIQDITNRPASPRSPKDGVVPKDENASAKGPAGTTPSPSKAAPPVPRSPSRTRECDYDANPTALYKQIESKNWTEALEIVNASSDQAATWVSRKELSGKLRWRLLPLHAAIVFKSPERIVEHLLASYPLGAQSKDDQGMLPIHLAFRNGASEGVVNLLLVAYPQSIHVKDRKGRIPLVLAQASASANREAFLRALERGPSYYAVAAAATERAAVTAEQKAIFDTKLLEVEERHQVQVNYLQAEAAALKSGYEEKIQTLEGEVDSCKNMSNVLSDHISALEAQLESRGDAELLLANKCKKAEQVSRNTEAEREELETELQVEKRLNSELEEKVLTLEDELAHQSKLHQDKCLQYAELESSDQMQRSTQSKVNEELQNNLKTAQNTIMALDNRLKKRIGVERSLSTQLSEMSRQLAEANGAREVAENEMRNAAVSHKKTVTELEVIVADLHDRLGAVTEAMEGMKQEQDQILLASSNHEDTMDDTAGQQEEIVRELEEHEQFMEGLAKERQAVLEMLQKQAKDIELGFAQRNRIREAVQRQQEDFHKVEYVRNMMVDVICRQKDNLEGTIVDINAAVRSKKEEEESILRGDGQLSVNDGSDEEDGEDDEGSNGRGRGSDTSEGEGSGEEEGETLQDTPADDDAAQLITSALSSESIGAAAHIDDTVVPAETSVYTFEQTTMTTTREDYVVRHKEIVASPTGSELEVDYDLKRLT